MSGRSRDILSEINIGRIPPQSLEIEEAILGAILIEKEMLFQVIDDLAPEKFYKETHQLIYKAIMQLWETNSPIDILTVTGQLRKTGDLETVGGPLFITQLSSRTSTAINIEYYVKILSQKWIQREMIRMTSEINKKSYDEDVDIADTIGDAISRFSDLMNSAVKGNTVHISEVSRENIRIIEDCMAGKITLIGIPTGIKELDEYCNGLQKSDLVILAGRPSMGKTALMCSIIYNIAVEGNALAVIFSLEMSKRQIDLRLKIIGTEIESNKIIRSKIDRYELDKIMEISKKIEKGNIYIDDTPGLNINEIWARLKRISIEKTIDVVFVDYIQLMTSPYTKGRNREQEVSEISRGLKNIAREFDVPVVALAQLNRMVEMTQNQKPKLSHLRESGSLEQDSDQVWFVYRPWKAGIKEFEDGGSTYNKAEIFVAKHRNGPTGDCKVGFKENWMKFMNLEEMSDSQLEIPANLLFDEDDGKEQNPF